MKESVSPPTDWLALERQYDSGIYNKRDITLVRGEGARVWDSDGVEYLDCTSAYGVANLGHCHPAVVKAIQEQAGQLISVSQSFGNNRRAQFYAAFRSVLPDSLSRFFPVNSGAEAIEAALKFARVATGRKKWVAAMRGFSGRTMGALSVTWEKAYREPFAPLVEPVQFIPYNDVDALVHAVDSETAAVILEPIQGEGGVRPATVEFLSAARKQTQQQGALLVLDEIQTGFGRTGKFFAMEHFGVTPDILTLAKAVGGGVPLGVTAMTSAVADAIPKGAHGSTFGGNPLAMAAGFAVIQTLKEERLWERADSMGESWMEQVRSWALPRVREVRGRGLMIGIELKEKAAPFIQRLQHEYRIITIPAGPNVIRLLPPLVIEMSEWARAAQALREVLS